MTTLAQEKSTVERPRIAYSRPAIVSHSSEWVDVATQNEGDVNSWLVTLTKRHAEPGLVFTAPKRLPAGTEITIDFWTPDQSFAFTFRATVFCAIRAKNGWQTRVQFTPRLSDVELRNLP